jgi:hypothetical protein
MINIGRGYEEEWGGSVYRVFTILDAALRQGFLYVKLAWN